MAPGRTMHCVWPKPASRCFLLEQNVKLKGARFILEAAGSMRPQPRSWLITAVRSPISRERTRWSACRSS